MSRLILFCEGRRDVRLVETYYEEVGQDVGVARFHAEDYEYSTVERQQPDRIRSFTSMARDDVLAKSEGGRDDLLERFAEYLRMLVRLSPRLCLLIDLDTGPNGNAQTRYRGKIDQLDTRVGDKHGDQYGVETEAGPNQNGTMLTAQCRLTAEEYGNTG